MQANCTWPLKIHTSNTCLLQLVSYPEDKGFGYSVDIGAQIILESHFELENFWCLAMVDGDV